MRFSIMRLGIMAAIIAVWAATSGVLFVFMPAEMNAFEAACGAFILGAFIPAGLVSLTALLYFIAGDIERAIKRNRK